MNPNETLTVPRGSDLWNSIFRDREIQTESITDTTTDKPIGQLRILGTTFEDTFRDRHSYRLAFVGTRDLSPKGHQLIISTMRYMKEIDCNTIIISGLAMGTQELVHAEALRNGLRTVAVLPAGIGNIYPYKNKSLAEKIASTPGCCLLSQFPDDDTPNVLNFLKRNKLMSLIPDAVIVVSTKEKGGSIVTARMAFDFDVPVYAFPGDIEDVRFKGNNKLIALQTAEIIPDYTFFQSFKHLP